MLAAVKRLFPGIGIEGDEPKPAPTGAAGDPTPEPKPKEPAGDPGPKDPLADFAGIFDNKPAGEPDPKDIPLSVAGILNEETLNKLVGSIDFNSFLSDETKAALNDPEGDGTAVFKAFNEIAGGSYRTAIQHAGKVSESVMDDRMTRFEKSLGERINAHNLKSNISTDDAINQSPVLKAGITMIADSLLKSQPDADPKWVTEQARKFFVEAGKSLGGGQSNEPGSSPDNTPGSGEDTNWVGFAMGDEVNNPSGEGDPQGGTGEQ